MVTLDHRYNSVLSLVLLLLATGLPVCSNVILYLKIASCVISLHVKTKRFPFLSILIGTLVKSEYYPTIVQNCLLHSNCLFTCVEITQNITRWLQWNNICEMSLAGGFFLQSKQLYASLKEFSHSTAVHIFRKQDNYHCFRYNLLKLINLWKKETVFTCHGESLTEIFKKWRFFANIAIAIFTIYATLIRFAKEQGNYWVTTND